MYALRLFNLIRSHAARLDQHSLVSVCKGGDEYVCWWPESGQIHGHNTTIILPQINVHIIRYPRRTQIHCFEVVGSTHGRLCQPQTLTWQSNGRGEWFLAIYTTKTTIIWMGRMGVAVQSSYISGDFARIGCFSPLLAWLPSLKIHHTIYVCSAVEDGIEHRIITIYTTIKNKSWSTISKEWILLFWVGLSWLFTIQTIIIMYPRKHSSLTIT